MNNFAKYLQNSMTWPGIGDFIVLDIFVPIKNVSIFMHIDVFVPIKNVINFMYIYMFVHVQ